MPGEGFNDTRKAAFDPVSREGFGKPEMEACHPVPGEGFEPEKDAFDVVREVLIVPEGVKGAFDVVREVLVALAEMKACDPLPGEGFDKATVERLPPTLRQGRALMKLL